MIKVWLGVDTSNYTTSVAAVTSDGKIYNLKAPLTVKENEKGDYTLIIIIVCVLLIAVGFGIFFYIKRKK